MRLAFLGTPEAAVPSLRALVEAGHDVAMVISQPDRRRGRGALVTASPVKAAAEELGLIVAADLAALDDVDVERAVVVAYGQLIPGTLLERIPMLNVHFSLLPRWRGAAPVERAILAGDEVTGVGIISLETTLDTGPLHGERRTSTRGKTASALTAELAEMGAALLVDVLDDPQALASPRPQVGPSTYAAKLTPADFRLNATMSPLEATRVVALERAFLTVQGRRLKVHSVDPSDAQLAAGTLRARGSEVVVGLTGGALALGWVQPEGSRAMSAAAWWAGARLGDGVAWQ